MCFIFYFKPQPLRREKYGTTITRNIFETMIDTRKNKKDTWAMTIGADAWRVPTLLQVHSHVDPAIQLKFGDIFGFSTRNSLPTLP